MGRSWFCRRCPSPYPCSPHYAVHTPNRETFINSVISLLRTHNFNVLDVCFLYPGLRGRPMHDRGTFLN